MRQADGGDLGGDIAVCELQLEADRALAASAGDAPARCPPAGLGVGPGFHSPNTASLALPDDVARFH